MAIKQFKCKLYNINYKCSFTKIDVEDPLTEACAQHEIKMHGEADTPELRPAIAATFIPPPPPAGD